MKDYIPVDRENLRDGIIQILKDEGYLPSLGNYNPYAPQFLETNGTSFPGFKPTLTSDTIGSILFEHFAKIEAQRKRRPTHANKEAT